MARGADPRDPYSYLHPATTVEGTVRAERLRIDGTVRGSVEVEGTLEIAPGGRIEGGPVRARDVRIAGEVAADVRAEGTVEIWPGGTLRGDVRAGALDVDEGGRFLGRSLSLDADDPPLLDAVPGLDGASEAPRTGAVAKGDAAGDAGPAAGTTRSEPSA